MSSLAYMREYLSRKYYERRARLLDMLGWQCVRCGARESLEFDHIEAKTKSFDIAKRLAGAAWEVLEGEARKCQLLCKGCHRNKSVESGDVAAPATHGTYAMYVHHKCRCEPCRAANAAAKRTYDAKSRQRALG